MSKVSITRCSSYDKNAVLRAVTDALELLGGVETFVRRSERILVKPNLLSGKPPEAAVTTHPEIVRAILIVLKEAGVTPVVGDSPGFGAARSVADKCGVMSVCNDLGVEVIDLKTLEVVPNPGGRVFKRLEVAREALEFDGIVNLPKLKTHAQMHLTMAVKNLFGCVPGKLKPQWHLSAGVESSYFAQMLLDLSIFLSPRFTVMDAIVGMEGNGPGSGKPRELGLVFAAADSVAMDTVAASILGALEKDVPILEAALARGMGSAKAENIEVLGVDPAILRIKDFDFPPRMHVNFAAMLPGFLDKPLRKSITTRPHVNALVCTLCSICVNVCPAEVMTRDKRIIIDYDRCIRCYCCQEMCPEGAISPKDGWLKKALSVLS